MQPRGKLPLRQRKNLRMAKWTLRQQANFFELLADLLTAGFSLKQALQSLKVFLPKNGLATVIAELETGQSFSQALRSKVTTNIYCQLVIAEKHGSVEQSVFQLGKYLKKRVQQREKLQSLLLYPAIILGLLLFLMIALKIWLAPEIAQFSVSTTGKDPFSYLIFVKFGGLVLLSLFILGVIHFFYWWKKQSIFGRHSWYSSLPIVGSLYRQYNCYYLTFNLGLLIESGLEFQQICGLLEHFEEKSLLYHLGRAFSERLARGEKLTQIMEHYPFIPPELALFFQKGRSKEEIGKDLLAYSKLAYQKLLEKSDHLLAWVQPLLFMVIAIVIICTYLALLLPLYSSLGGLYK